MYDDFFFPYEKAKLWTGNMFLLSLSNFLLYASLYMMLPVLPLWMVRHWYCSYAEAGAAIAVFGLACSFREHSTATLLIRSNVKVCAL